MRQSRSIEQVLVTGAAGLVGSHLCDRLLASGLSVIAVDDLSVGSFANVAHLRRAPNYVFFEHDVARAFEARVDAVYHLAMPASRRSCEADPVRAAVTSVMGTVHVLDAAMRAGASRVVLATAVSPWGGGVQCAESIALHFARERGLDVRLVRVASAYGPRMGADEPHVVVESVLRLMQGEMLEVDAELDPAERRERLTYVDDAVDTLVRSMGEERRIPAVIAPYAEATRRDVARAVLEASGSPVAAERGGVSRVDLRALTTPDGLPAEVAFGPLSTVNLVEGVARTLAWFEARLAKHPAAARTSGVFVRGASVVEVPAKAGSSAA